MKKIKLKNISIVYAIFAFAILFFSVFCCAPKTVLAVDSDYASVYNVYLTYSYPSTDEETINGLEYQDYTIYKGFIEDINEFINTPNAKLTNDEILELNKVKNTKIIPVVSRLANREDAIRTGVVDYLADCLKLKAEIANNPNLNSAEKIEKILILKNKKDQVYFKNKTDYTFITNSTLRLDFENEDARDEFALEDLSSIKNQNQANELADKTLNIEEIKAGYEEKCAHFDAVVAELKPIPDITSKDKASLNKLNEEINSYYNLIKDNIEEAGFDKNEFENKFSGYKWKVSIRLSQIREKTNTSVIWIALCALIGAVLLYLAGYCLFIYIKRKKIGKHNS